MFREPTAEKFNPSLLTSVLFCLINGASLSANHLGGKTGNPVVLCLACHQ